MPFDPFFTSAHKKHYVPVPGADELYAKISAMTFEDRLALIQEWKKHGYTPAEHAALKILMFHNQGKRWARIHTNVEKRIDIATEEMKQGKRVRRVETNTEQFNTVGGAVNPKQKRGSRG